MREIGQNLIKKTLYLTNIWAVNKNWADLLQIDQQNLNLSIDSFFKNMNSILDAHAPLKKVNKYKLKSRIKP